MAKPRIPMGMGGNMNNMIKQAQKMQQEMMKMQEEMEQSEFEASAGGGVVTVKMSGKKELVSVTIKPEAVDPDDVEMLEDLVLTAVNDALKVSVGVHIAVKNCCSAVIVFNNYRVVCVNAVFILHAGGPDFLYIRTKCHKSEIYCINP